MNGRRAQAGAISLQRSSGSSGFLRRAEWSETAYDAVFLGFLAVLAWLPLFYGSNRPLAWAANAVMIGSLLAAFEALSLFADRPRPVALRRIGWVIALFAAVVGWIIVQTLPGVPQAWQSDFWPLARDVLTPVQGADPVAGRMSATPDAGLVALLRLVTTAGAFYLALQLCRDPSRARLFGLGLVIIIACYALYGVVQLLFFPEMLPWGPKSTYLDAVTSTFVNRNSFATYAIIGLLTALGLMLHSLQPAGGSPHLPLGLRASELLARLLRQALPLAAPLLVIVIALLWTLSRAGLLCAGIGVAALILLYGIFGRHYIVQLLLGVLTALTFTGLVIAYGEGTAERIATAEGFEARAGVALQTLDAARGVPFTGFGYGSFAEVYPVYRNDRFLDSFWTRAHNTYVELAFELGFPAALAVMALGAGVLVMIVNNLRRRESRPALSLVALAASVAALAHSLVDFSLQIQAVGVTFWALLGAGLSQSWSRRDDTRR